MTNKDYKRLTDTGIPTTTPDDVYNRLYELENAIEKGTLMFLPFAVGDEFWCFAEYYSLSDGWVNLITKHTLFEYLRKHGDEEVEQW